VSALGSMAKSKQGVRLDLGGILGSEVRDGGIQVVFGGDDEEFVIGYSRDVSFIVP